MASMFPHKVVYQAGKSKLHTETKMHASRFASIVYGFMRGIGLGTAVFVLLLFGALFGGAVKEEVSYELSSFLQNRQIREAHLANLPIVEHTIAIQNEAKHYGVDPHFSIVIPKIDAKANVIPNVSTQDKSEYEAALQKGIAHAAGTYFPGQGKNIYLFSHSANFDFDVTRYNAVFYLLRKLEIGDRVIVYFSDDRFVYEVEDLFVVSATDTKWLTDKYDSEVLFLQTCDPPGTTWRRLVVKAKPVEA